MQKQRQINIIENFTKRLQGEHQGDGDKFRVNINNKNVQGGSGCHVRDGWWWIFDQGEKMALLQGTEGHISDIYLGID